MMKNPLGWVCVGICVLNVVTSIHDFNALMGWSLATFYAFLYWQNK